MTKLEALRAAYADSSPGAWVQEDAFIFAPDFRVADYTAADEDVMPDDMQDANAQFSALAHNLMPMLLETVDELQRTRNELSHLVSQCPCLMTDIDRINATLARFR